MAPPAFADVETCRGLAATIVGMPDEEVVGTGDNDVIVAHYAQGGSVDAGDGDDVICVVNAPAQDDATGGLAVVSSGPGDDVVDTTALRASAPGVLTGPGAGHDEVYGGDAADFVTVAVTGPDAAPDLEPDLFTTGGGNDRVSVGAAGSLVGGVVDLGAGADEVVFAGRGQAPGGSIDGGPGVDRLRFGYEGPFGEPAQFLPTGPLLLDNHAGRATLGGTAFLTWSGLEGFDVSHLVKNRVSFQGKALDEHLSLGVRTGTVRLGGGDDRLSLAHASPASGAAAGGRGRDLVDADIYGDAELDLGGHITTTILHSKTGTMRLAGFENADVLAQDVHVQGTAAPNVIGARGSGTVDVQARGGADRVTIGNHPQWQLEAGNHRIARGGAGPDVLTGSTLPDVLIGGPGPDKAKAGRGRDHCLAEIQQSCELSA